MIEKLRENIKKTIAREKYLHDFRDFCFAPFIKVVV